MRREHQSRWRPGQRSVYSVPKLGLEFLSPGGVHIERLPLGARRKDGCQHVPRMVSCKRCMALRGNTWAKKSYRHQNQYAPPSRTCGVHPRRLRREPSTPELISYWKSIADPLVWLSMVHPANLNPSIKQVHDNSCSRKQKGEPPPVVGQIKPSRIRRIIRSRLRLGWSHYFVFADRRRPADATAVG